MSLDLQVFLKADRMPSIKAWFLAMEQAGFPLALAEETSQNHLGGFLPILLAGEESGFEFDLSPLAPDDLPVALQTGEFSGDTLASFRFLGEDESLCASAAAAVLAIITDGVSYDLQSGELSHGEQGLVEARESFARSVYLHELVKKEKTASKWGEYFGRVLADINPAYRRNRDYSGRLVEFYREDASGLYVSMNTISIHGTFHHCFAMPMTLKKLGPGLFSPLVAGARFDNNFRPEIELELPPAMARWDFYHDWDENVEGRLRRYIEAVENIAVPRYRRVLARGRRRLRELLEEASKLLEALEKPDISTDDPELFRAFMEIYRWEPKDVTAWSPMTIKHYMSLKKIKAKGFHALAALVHREKCTEITAADVATCGKMLWKIPRRARNTAIAFYHLGDFAMIRDELPKLVEVVKGLERHRW